MHYTIKASRLQGHLGIPASKSHTLRAILWASLAEGQSTIRRYLASPDTQAMINACRALGATIAVSPEHLQIEGVAGQPRTPDDVIDAGNSGQVLRFIGAIAALTPGYTVLTGDESIRHNRPVQPLLDGLTALKVLAVSSQGNGTAPIIIKGPHLGGETFLAGEDSQPVSGLLMASALAPQPTIIHVSNPGETPWIDLTLSWFKRLNIPYQQQGYHRYEIPGQARYPGFDYTVPGDFSSCAFPLVAALITRSAICLENIDYTDSQGDKAIIPVLQQMGAELDLDTTDRKLWVKPSASFQGVHLDVNAFIDAVPILAVMACFAEQPTVLTGAAIARRKESNRLAAICQELHKMGARIRETDDGLIIHPAPLTGTTVDSHHDHRIAMALTVAGLGADGETVVTRVQCIDKSYPRFAEALQQLHAHIAFSHAD